MWRGRLISFLYTINIVLKIFLPSGSNLRLVFKTKRWNATDTLELTNSQTKTFDASYLLFKLILCCERILWSLQIFYNYKSLTFKYYICILKTWIEFLVTIGVINDTPKCTYYIIYSKSKIEIVSGGKKTFAEIVQRNFGWLDIVCPQQSTVVTNLIQYYSLSSNFMRLFSSIKSSLVGTLYAWGWA